jgi:hypothetical protein
MNGKASETSSTTASPAPAGSCRGALAIRSPITRVLNLPRAVRSSRWTRKGSRVRWPACESIADAAQLGIGPRTASTQTVRLAFRLRAPHPRTPWSVTKVRQDLIVGRGSPRVSRACSRQARCAARTSGVNRTSSLPAIRSTDIGPAVTPGARIALANGRAVLGGVLADFVSVIPSMPPTIAGDLSEPDGKDELSPPCDHVSG